MQGLADGYFVVPYTLTNFFASASRDKVSADQPEFREAEQEVNARINKLLSVKGKRTVNDFHRELGKMVWEKCGMARNATGLKELLQQIPELREEFWKNVNVLGDSEELNPALERAGRVADFMEFAELLTYDALHREESCGGHFREEYQTEDGEAKRDDEHFSYVAAWGYTGVGNLPELSKEPLEYEEVHMTQRSYK
jgi:succinate dehydrogenase / fumarate reductase flavoprotein subunit